MAACSSTEEKAMKYYLYPPPIARYKDVIVNRKLFMDTLGNFHAAMGTKFMIPIVGGKDLDLHRLFVEVTSRGGIKKVLEEKKWKEVTNSFNFPPSATNASFIIRKYYMSLIHHFEQVYYFKAKAWTPVSSDIWQSTKSTLTSNSGLNKAVLPLPQFQMDGRSPYEVTPMKQQRTTIEDLLPKASSEPSIGFPVMGIIDGKFDSGYLCTVVIGGEQLRGVLFRSTEDSSYQLTQCQTTTGIANRPSTIIRRRRRKKSEMKRRDPAHPKPNRSGYNFFFAEQHARLKPLHPGKDRDISRMIGELWNNLTESKKAVYQEKAMEDKERYRIEMVHYRESLRTGRIVSTEVPVLQQPFNETAETDGGGGASPESPENELTSACSDKSSFKIKVTTADNCSNSSLPPPVAATVTKIGDEERRRDFEIGRKGEILPVAEQDKPKSVSALDNETVNAESNHDGKPYCENESKYEFEVELDRTVEQRPLKESVTMNENLDREPDVFREDIPMEGGDEVHNVPASLPLRGRRSGK
ncbi:hypothetical protein L2E82_29075 [Cichorium intybus]|uniref:Uncharacterized protein n=1 Tax=Cichorium intybus TaxID=13427 RepID=A0ACB9CX12_CICIN|nr:hypothetical protein L2E82_29075 [Cichorium intybus]